MAVAKITETPFRELAHRESDGLKIVLSWHCVSGDLTVCVSDVRSGAYFELPAAPKLAMDIFEHPYAYAAFRGVPYDEALLPAGAQAVTRNGSRGAQQLREPTT